MRFSDTLFVCKSFNSITYEKKKLAKRLSP